MRLLCPQAAWASTLQDVTSNAGTIFSCDRRMAIESIACRKEVFRSLLLVSLINFNISIYLCYPDISSTYWHMLYRRGKVDVVSQSVCLYCHVFASPSARENLTCLLLHSFFRYIRLSSASFLQGQKFVPPLCDHSFSPSKGKKPNRMRGRNKVFPILCREKGQGKSKKRARRGSAVLQKMWYLCLSSLT